MTLATPTLARPFIPYRKIIEIDYDSLDFDPYESVEKPDAMHQHNEQLEMLYQIRGYFAEFGESPNVFVDFDSHICWDTDDLRHHISPDVYIAFCVDAEAISERMLYIPQEVGKPPTSRWKSPPPARLKTTSSANPASTSGR